MHRLIKVGSGIKQLEKMSCLRLTFNFKGVSPKLQLGLYSDCSKNFKPNESLRKVSNIFLTQMKKITNQCNA